MAMLKDITLESTVVAGFHHIDRYEYDPKANVSVVTVGPYKDKAAFEAGADICGPRDRLKLPGVNPKKVKGKDYVNDLYIAIEAMTVKDVDENGDPVAKPGRYAGAVEDVEEPKPELDEAGNPIK